MTRPRRTRSPSTPERPQQYEERIEIAIEALGHALSACGKIISFMLAEQTPEWGRDDLPKEAAGELRQALKWLAKQRSQSRKR